MKLKKLSWKKTTLSNRILLALSSTLILIIACFLTLVSLAYEHDKIAYLYDLQDIQTEKLSEKARQSLRALANSRALSPANEQKYSENLVAYGLPKIPDPGEVYLGQSKQGHLFILKRNENGLLYEGDLSGFNKDLASNFKIFSLVKGIEKSEHLTYWVTSFGTLLAANQDLPGNVISDREIVREFLSTSLTHGLVHIPHNPKNILGSFREVSGTNTVIFIETDLQAALKPLRQFIWVASFVGLVISLFGLLVCKLFLTSLWAPIHHLRGLLKTVANGDYDVRYSYDFEDEITPIFSGIVDMASVLQFREDKLIRVKSNLEQALAFSMQMSVAAELDSILTLGIKALVANVRLSNRPSIVVSLVHDRGAALELENMLVLDQGEILVKFIRSTDVLSTVEQTSGAPSELNNSEESELETLLRPNGELVLPLQKGKKQLGQILIRNYALESLDPVDKIFVEMIANSVSVALENLRLRESEVTRIRLEADMEMANAIQSNLLPQNNRSGTVPACIDIGSYYMAAEKTGGDWFGYHFEPESNQFYFYVSDVTGHGIASALLTSVICGSVYATAFVLQNLQSSKGLPAQSLEERLLLLQSVLQKVVLETGRAKYMMSMAFFGIDLNTGEVSTLSAGHPAPYLYRKNKNKIIVPAIQSDLIGVSNCSDGVSKPDLCHKFNRFSLEKGDFLFVYTDGLIENEGPGGGFFSRKLLRNSLAENHKNTAQVIVDNIIYDGKKIWKNQPPKDDVTLLALKWNGG